MAVRMVSAIKTVNTGAAVKLGASGLYASSVILYADPLNTNNIYWGDSGIDTTKGIPLSKSQQQNITYDMVYGTNGKIDLSTIYLASDTDGNVVRYTYFVWDGV